MDDRTLSALDGPRGLLEIAGLTVFTEIGVYAFEKKIKQKVILDLHIPLQKMDDQDQLAQVIDYAELAKAVTEFVEMQSFELIETLAYQVSSFLKKKYQVSIVTVKVSKPFAVANAQNVSITVYG